MKLFNKHLDIEKDHLRLEFDLDGLCYVVFHGFDPISYEKLNRKSRKMLDKKNYELKNNPSYLEKERKIAKQKRRFQELKNMGYPCNSFEYLGPNIGTMSDEMKNFLNSLISEENVLLGVHRVGENFDNNVMNDIFNNGLLITGHLGGATESTKALHQNVSYYPDNSTIIKELMFVNAYKNSSGSILIRIPDDDLKNGNIFITDANNNIRLNPKYIIGYVPLDEKISNHIEKIIRNLNSNYNPNYNIDDTRTQSSHTFRHNENPLEGAELNKRGLHK